MTERVGILGGSFDPVHNAHLALARSAVQALALDELLWIPAGRPWQKQRELAPAGDRVAMLRLAIAGEGRFSLELCEIERAAPSYTIETLDEMQRRRPGVRWFLLLGQDQLANLPTWHRWRELLTRVTLAVANRAGETPRLPAELSAREVTLSEVPLPALAISSTDIRARVAAGREIDALVPVPVARYIDAHGLYRDPLRS